MKPSRWRGRKRILLVCLFWTVSEGAQSQIEAPRPVLPSNGSVRDLPPGRTDIAFVWTAVNDATGYLFTIMGPPGFSGFENLEIEPATPTVSRTFLGFIPGSYTWQTRATGLGAVSSATPSTFTVPTPLPTGGDLPPPVLFGPPDYSIFRGRRGGRIAFQWSVVPGASSYDLQVEPFQGAGSYFKDAAQSVDGGTVQQFVTFFPNPNAIGIFTWRVVPIDAAGEGIPSREAHLLFSARDLVADKILFTEALGWYSSGSLMDANGDNRADAVDLAPALPFQRSGKVLVAGQIGPNLVGQSVDLTGATLTWRTLGGVDSYEVNVLDASGAFDSTFMIRPVSGAANQSYRMTPLPPSGNYKWRVRGFFGFELDSTPYSADGSFQVIGISR